MMPFAILSLSLAILIWLLCYGILSAAATLGTEGEWSGILWALGGFVACAALIIWGIWFIAHRWPVTR